MKIRNLCKKYNQKQLKETNEKNKNVNERKNRNREIMTVKAEIHCYACNSKKHQIRECDQRLKVYVANTEGIRKIIEKYEKIKRMKIRPTENRFMKMLNGTLSHKAQIVIKRMKEIFRMDSTGTRDNIFSEREQLEKKQENKRKSAKTRA